MKHSEFVEKIVETLEDHGWTQGSFQDEKGLCWLGACNYVGGVNTTNLDSKVGLQFGHWLKYKGIHSGGSISAWNDDELNTKELVIKTTQMFIDDLKEDNL